MIRSVDFLGKLVFEWKLVNFWKTIGSRAKLLIARHPVHHALVARPYVEETLEVTVSCKSTDCISAWRKKLVQKASSAKQASSKNASGYYNWNLEGFVLFAV